MWAERYAAAARRHPDLIGVYESGGGRVALLLRQTVVPLAEERRQWLAETRRVARAVIGSLRAAGLRGEVLVLQWRPLREVANVVRHWICRYAGDPERCHQLVRVVERYLADRQFVVAHALPPYGLSTGDDLAADALVLERAHPDGITTEIGGPPPPSLPLPPSVP